MSESYRISRGTLEALTRGRTLFGCVRGGLVTLACQVGGVASLYQEEPDGAFRAHTTDGSGDAASPISRGAYRTPAASSIDDAEALRASLEESILAVRFTEGCG